MNILHVSDIHYRQQYAAQTEGYQGMLGRMQSPMIPLTTCIERAKEKHTIDLLIVSGDLTEDGSPEDYAYLKQNLRDMLGEIPILVTLGNHDIKANFRQGWCQSASESSPYNQVFDAGDFRIICFDNSCHGFADGVVDERQFLWLEEILGEEDGKPVLFVTHHHLLKAQASTSAWPGADRLLDLLGNKDICAILCGHTHHAYTGTVRGIPYFTVASMSFVGEDEGNGIVRFEERYGYNLYTITAGKLTYHSAENFRPNHVLMRLDMRQ